MGYYEGGYIADRGFPRALEGVTMAQGGGIHEGGMALRGGIYRGGMAQGGGIYEGGMAQGGGMYEGRYIGG